MLALSRLQKKFSAHDFNRVAADAHVNYAVIAARGPNKNAARPLHLNPLFDEHALVGPRYAVRHHPGRSATSRRARRRILAVIERHTSVQSRLRIHRLAGDEIKKLPRGPRQ